MALPVSGPLSFSQIRAAFGGPTPIKLSDYYRGGSYVPNIPANAGIPTSGPISVSNFYGAVGVLHTAIVTRGGVDPHGYEAGVIGSISAASYQDATNVSRTIILLFYAAATGGTVGFGLAGTNVPNADTTFASIIFEGGLELKRLDAGYNGNISGTSRWGWTNVGSSPLMNLTTAITLTS